METVGKFGVCEFYCNTDVDDLIRVVKKQYHSVYCFCPLDRVG